MGKLNIVSDGTVAGTAITVVDGETETPLTNVCGLELKRQGTDIIAVVEVRKPALSLKEMTFAQINLEK